MHHLGSERERCTEEHPLTHTRSLPRLLLLPGKCRLAAVAIHLSHIIKESGSFVRQQLSVLAHALPAGDGDDGMFYCCHNSSGHGFLLKYDVNNWKLQKKTRVFKEPITSMSGSCNGLIACGSVEGHVVSNARINPSRLGHAYTKYRRIYQRRRELKMFALADLHR